MSAESQSMRLPFYQAFETTIATLDLPFSSSELHGVVCGFLCLGATHKGEHYLRALIGNKKTETVREAASALFNLYSISQQQLSKLDFEFQLLLPDDQEPLISRATAFSEWCHGFLQGLAMSGKNYQNFDDEELNESILHLTEFAELDCDALEIDEEDDEKALMEICEYTRMTVLRLYQDFLSEHDQTGFPETTH